MVEGNVIKPVETKVQFRTERKVPKVRYLSCIAWLLSYCICFFTHLRMKKGNGCNRFVFRARSLTETFSL
jgi:hypothetical protein